MQRIYIDSNILLNWLFGVSTTKVKPSSDFLNEVIAGKFEGIITSLTLNEVIKVTRNIMTGNGKTEPGYWKSKEKEAMRKIFELPAKNVIISNDVLENLELSEDELNFEKISDEALTLIKKYQGSTKINEDGKTEHDGLSTVDSLHLAIAKKIACDKIATADADFKETEAELPVLFVKEVYPVR